MMKKSARSNKINRIGKNSYIPKTMMLLIMLIVGLRKLMRNENLVRDYDRYIGHFVSMVCLFQS